MRIVATIITIAVIIAALLILAETKIQFNPFKITMTNGLKAGGYLLIFVGATLIEMQGRLDASKETIYKVKEIFNEAYKIHKEKL